MTTPGGCAYLCFTPYHLLLAMSLIADDQPEALPVILFADESGVLGAVPGLRELVEKSAEVVQLRPGVLPSESLRARSRRVKNHVRIAMRMRQLGRNRTVRICNGLRLEAEFASRFVRGDGTLDYIEDGLDAYLDLNVVLLSRFDRLKRFPRDGFRPRQRVDQTIWLPFQRYFVLQPAMSRLPTDACVTVISHRSFRSTVRELADLVHIDVPRKSVTALRLLDHSQTIVDRDQYVREVRQWAKDEPIRLGVAAVKVHPRENDASFVRKLGELDVVQLPQALPAEMLSNYLSDSCDIYCGLTTFILTSRLIIPQRRINLSPGVRAEHRSHLMAFDAGIV